MQATRVTAVMYIYGGTIGGLHPRAEGDSEDMEVTQNSEGEVAPRTQSQNEYEAELDPCWFDHFET